MGDADVGKLFIFGMSRETTEEALKDYFSKYGDVSMTAIAKDKVTNISRGWGFVTFLNPSSVDVALRDLHVISDRTVEVKEATPRNMQQTASQQDVSTSHGSYKPNNVDQSSNSRSKKIFVGGLPSNLTEEDFKAYFETFGRITDVVIMHDRNTNRPRGFGFITFESEQSVEDLMQVTRHELAGKLVEVKRAVPREAMNKYSNKDSNNYSDRGYASQAYHNPDFYYGYHFCNSISYGYDMPIFITHGLWSCCPTPYGTGYYPTTLNGGVATMGMVNPYNNYLESNANVNGSSLESEKGVVNGE